MDATKYFFELLQMSVGQRSGLSGTPTKEEWQALVKMAHRQALVGVFTASVCLLPEEQRPPRKTIARLCSETMLTEDVNIRLFRRCCDLTASLAADGFDTCILKGQGTALLYPAPLLRQSGDIDVWIKPQATDDTLIPLENRIYDYAQTKGTVTEVVYHHLCLSIPPKADKNEGNHSSASRLRSDEIEIHFRPSFMFCPYHNRRLQRWFDAQWLLMKEHTVQVPEAFLPSDGNKEPNTFYCPTPQFNIIYSLAHAHRHLYDEGIGLRQLLDYYHILFAAHQAAPVWGKDKTAEREHITMLLKQFGLYRFGCAVMFVLHEVFALPIEMMIVPMDVKAGRFLLSEVLRAGNFGQYDDRIKITSHETPLHKLLRREHHSLRLLRYFPSEVLWQLPFKLWHRHWRFRHGWIDSYWKD